MGILSTFNIKPNRKKISNDLSSLIIQVAINESVELIKLWEKSLDDKTQIQLFVHYSTMLVSIVDRLIYEKFNDPYRSDVMNLVIDIIKSSFCKQSNFGETELERGQAFESMFTVIFSEFSGCNSIMGEDENNIVLKASEIFVKEYLEDITSSTDRNKILFNTGKSISLSVTALFTTSIFKKIT